MFTFGHHNRHNGVSNTLAKKREPSKYNTMKPVMVQEMYLLIVQVMVIHTRR